MKQEENSQQIIHRFIKHKMLLKYVSIDNAAILEQRRSRNLAQIVTLQAIFGRRPVRTSVAARTI
jgi:hypothetical protein